MLLELTKRDQRQDQINIATAIRAGVVKPIDGGYTTAPRSDWNLNRPFSVALRKRG